VFLKRFIYKINELDFKICHVLNIIFFLLGDFSASEFYILTFWNTLFHLHKLMASMMMEQTKCSKTSAYKIQTPRNHPKERIQQTKCTAYDQ